jgi:hypothetical protein
MVQLPPLGVVVSLFFLVSLVSFAAITLCVASKRVIPKVSVYFFNDSVRKLYIHPHMSAATEDESDDRHQDNFYAKVK